MLFLTYWFVFFVAALYPLYWLCRWRALRVLILLAACVVFHTHFAGPAGVLPIVVLSALDFALFTFFWPSIVAGPVKRYDEFLPALYQGLDGVGSQDVAEGLLRVAWGLLKKFAADNLTAWLKVAYPAVQAGQYDALWSWF